MSKRLQQNIFITVIIIIAFSLLYIFSVKNSESNLMYLSLDYESTYNIFVILFWCILAIVAETFLIISPSSGAATSVAIAIYAYIMLVANPAIVMFVAFIGSVFRFPEYDGERKHFLNTKKSTTFFNMSNIMLSTGVCGYIIQFSKELIWANYLVQIIFVIIGLLAAEFINFVLVAILIKITQGVNPIQIFRSMAKTFPSTVAIGSLGLFLAFVHENYEMTIILVFFAPLLLARYSFKLYFDSQRMALDTIHALNEALHAKDAYTGGHTGRVEKYSVSLAEAYGLNRNDVELIRTAALLHDIGKIGIPDGILNKPGKLTDAEFEKIQEHSTIGAKILGNVNSLKKVSEIVVQHHERYDGTGYPYQLSGDQLSIEAQILMISDSYDAMTSDRPYRDALSKEVAINELEKYSGTQFHPLLARTFIDFVLNVESNENLEIDDVEILEKTKEVVEAGSDLPVDVMESEKV